MCIKNTEQIFPKRWGKPKSLCLDNADPNLPVEIFLLTITSIKSQMQKISLLIMAFKRIRMQEIFQVKIILTNIRKQVISLVKAS